MTGPTRACGLCPRLVDYRQSNCAAHPDWFNAPVPSFGALDAIRLVVGLAPGLKGANRTGRPFTGDYAGDLLYATLVKLGCATGDYQARPDDGLTLIGTRITNAVRCVPPANKPVTSEFRNCLPFLASEMSAMPNLRAILAIGRDAHEAVLASLSLRKALFPFAHGAVHPLRPGLTMVDSYHCSRLNTNTGRLTTPMFESAVAALLRV